MAGISNSKNFTMKYLFLPLILLLSSCAGGKLVTHKFPRSVDTTTRPIEYQEKKTYTIGSVSASNEFPAARLNNFTQLNDSTYQATISPENSPINESPWYAFQIWSSQPRTIQLELHYTEHEHRYNPKISIDGENWHELEEELIYLDEDSIHATFKLELGEKKLWVAAQEIEDHRRVGEWVQQFSDNPLVTEGNAGTSVQNRSLYHMNITRGENKKKPTVIVISRQHPPEVTGYFAMQAFIETIIDEGAKNGFLDQYRVMVYPMLNPDGVDLGHFRHNTGGIDMNRDWSVYHQPEIRQIVNHIVDETQSENNNVILGLDFHSTYYDVYYTNDETVEKEIPGFTKEWLRRIEKDLNLDDINEQASGYGPPTSKGWFNKQLGAESITYEIGDDTPRDFIKVKGRVSAVNMMDILLEYGPRWGLFK